MSRAEDLRRRLHPEGASAPPSSQLKKIAGDAITYAAELERRLEAREDLAGRLYAAAMAAHTALTGGTEFVPADEAAERLSRAMRAYEELFPGGLRCDEAGLLPGGVDCPGCARCCP